MVHATRRNEPFAGAAAACPIPWRWVRSAPAERPSLAHDEGRPLAAAGAGGEHQAVAAIGGGDALGLAVEQAGEDEAAARRQRLRDRRGERNQRAGEDVGEDE